MKFHSSMGFKVLGLTGLALILLGLGLGLASNLIIEGRLTQGYTAELSVKLEQLAADVAREGTQVEKALNWLHSSARLLEAVKGKGAGSASSTAELAIQSFDLDFLAVLDTRGRVVVLAGATGVPDSGLVAEPLVSKALAGNKTAEIQRRGDRHLVYSGAVPLADATGTVVGCVFLGRSLSTDTFVDTLSARYGTLVTVFEKNIRVATTVKNPEGKRLVGTTMDNPKVLSAVLERGQNFIGPVTIQNRPFLGAYSPLKAADGTTQGMLFVGRDLVLIRQLVDGMVWSLVLLVGAVSSVLLLILGLFLSRATLVPLRKAMRVMEDVARGEGDLTIRVGSSGRDEVGEMTRHFDLFAEALRAMVAQVKTDTEDLAHLGANLVTAMDQTSRAVAQILSSIEAVKAQSQSQAAGVAETSSAVEEIASNIESLDSLIVTQVASVSESSAAVEEMLANAASIGRSIDSMALQFLQLLSSAQDGHARQKQVQDAIVTISHQSETLLEANLSIAEIAAQTNLLAMNAAIEAAHAGEAGRGFSVVADEIRKLAINSSSESKRIGSELQDIQRSIAQVVLATADSSEAYSQILGQVEQTQALVSQLKGAIEDETTGSQRILGSLASMNSISAQVKQGSAEMKAGNRSIIEELSRLQQVTLAISGAMAEMDAGATLITQTVESVTGMAESTKTQIVSLTAQVGRFKV